MTVTAFRQPGAGNFPSTTLAERRGSDVRRQPSSGRAELLLIMAAVFMAFLVIGIAMPVLPLQVHRELGFGTFLVGLVTGVQFGAAILSRVWAGRYSDARGPKRATMAGLVLASAAGLVYDLSLTVAATPVLSLMVLLLGRALLGVGESLIITGAQSWALAILTVQNTSKALAWVGSAMFAAFAVGAPIGTALYASHGFAGIALATTLSPLATLLFVAPLQGVASASSVRTGAMKVMAAIWMPGLGAALSSIGFGAIVAFSALLFVERGWAPWVPFTAFASAFIVTRLVLGHLADRFGGARVALICVLVETAGLALMWLAPSFALTLTGAAVTGLGYALVYPGLGVEAVRLAPPDSRGLAMGAYTAFLDLALGISGPGLGLIAGAAGLDAVFLASACAAIGAAAIAVMLIRAQSRKDHERNAT